MPSPVQLAFAVTCVLLILPSDAMAGHQLSGPVNDFSVALFGKLLKEHPQQNVFASPFSVSTALSAVLLGARSDTAQQITSALRFDQLNLDNETNVHDLYAQLLEDSNENDNSSISLANYFLIQKELAANSILDKYKSDLESLYGARIDDVDFGTEGEQIVAKVNDWVNNKTHGLIPIILDKAPEPSTPALLLNSIYFKGKWLQPFGGYSNVSASFYNKGAEEKEATFMTKHRKFYPYMELTLGGEGVQAVELKYEEDSMSMYILLPRNRDGLTKLIANDSFESDLKSAISALNETEQTIVNLRIPKFEIRTKYGLKPTLESMGITNMFSGLADLSGVNGRSDMYVTDVTHKAFVKVDEEGTEAAAVTLVEYALKSGHFGGRPPIDFMADHPFIFLIKNKETGVVQFIGTVDQL